jgi:hypothetical protein
MSVYNPASGIVWAAPTAADNYNWIQLISTGLTTLGFPIDGTVSGQIVLSGGSVALPGSIAAGTLYSMGYEIRTMASAGLTTLKIRIDYKLWSTGTTAAGLYPVIVITVGTTVNTTTGVLGGAVTQAGASSANNSPIYSGSAPTVPRAIFMSSDGANYLTMVVDPGRAVAQPTTVALINVLERTITASKGAYNNAGYQNIGLGTQFLSATQDCSGIWNVNLSTNVSTYSQNFGVTFPGSMFSNSGSGTAATIAPVSVMVPVAQGPMLAALGYYNNDVAAGTTFTAMIYGANHTFLSTGIGYVSFSQAPTTTGTTTGFGAQRLAMRYE